jgi:hypothetical protein
MQACSTCGVGPYKNILDAGCYRRYSEHQSLPWRSIPRGDPGHLPHICGELPRAQPLGGLNVTSQPINDL